MLGARPQQPARDRGGARRAWAPSPTASSVYFNAPQLRLAARLAETFDAPLSRSLFIQSGADSNEAAVLFARRATGRSGIGALHLSFHGYTDVTRP